MRNRVGLEHGRAGDPPARRARRRGRADGRARAASEPAGGTRRRRRVGTLRGVHGRGPRRPFAPVTQAGQRRLGERASCGDVLGNPARQLLPAGGLPPSRTAPCPSRSPSGSRGRRRRRCRRCSRGGTRRSGTRRGTSATGTAPAGGAPRAELAELLAGVADLEDLRDSGRPRRGTAGSRPAAGSSTWISRPPLLAVEPRPGLLASAPFAISAQHLRHREGAARDRPSACRASCRSRARWCRGRPRRPCGNDALFGRPIAGPVSASTTS